jgi:hypothetical protein
MGSRVDAWLPDPTSEDGSISLRAAALQYVVGEGLDLDRAL